MKRKQAVGFNSHLLRLNTYSLTHHGDEKSLCKLCHTYTTLSQPGIAGEKGKKAAIFFLLRVQLICYLMGGFSLKHGSLLMSGSKSL